MAENKKVTVDLTTGIGTLSFPRVFKETANKKDDGTPSYDIQFIISKQQKADVRALLLAIKKVGEARWGTKWKSVRNPLRDGDAEADDLTEDGSTKGEKYPERLGSYFINARSTKPVGVYGRDRSPILNPDEIYGGCQGKIAVTFYPYSTSGNHGIGVALNGVQKVSDGESFGSSRPSVESMFDMLEEEDDLDLDEEMLDDEDEDEPEPEPKPRKRAAKKAPAKKAKAKPEPVDEDEDDLYDDLDDDDL
jgi:hypothetical protein